MPLPPRGVAVAMNVGKVPVSLPRLREEFGLSLVQAGWVSSTLTTLAVLSALGVGLLVARLGAMRMVLGGLLGQRHRLDRRPPGHRFAGLVASRISEGAGFLVVAWRGCGLISAAATRRPALLPGHLGSYMPAGA